MAITQRQYRQLHAVMQLICRLRKLTPLNGDLLSEKVSSQPIFLAFDKIYAEIPVIETKNDVLLFASRCKAQSLTLRSSIRAMEKSMHGPEQLAIQKLVYDLKHHAAEIKAQFLKTMEGKIDVEAAAPIINLLETIQTAGVNVRKLAEHDQNSGNAFCEARHEGGIAANVARNRKTVNARIAADQLYPSKLKIEKLWRHALTQRGAYGGQKIKFVREMVDLVRKERGLQLREERVIAWTYGWGGKLQKGKI